MTIPRPVSLRATLRFGRCAGQPPSAMWNSGLSSMRVTTLKRVTFGLRFNQANHGVAWPAHLQELSFGDNFNRAVAGTARPAGLRRLYFGKTFNQPIAGTA